MGLNELNELNELNGLNGLNGYFAFVGASGLDLVLLPYGKDSNFLELADVGIVFGMD
jgi:hypothetical protein